MKNFKLVTTVPRGRAIYKNSINYPIHGGPASETKGSVIVVPHNDILNIGSSDFSVSVWAKTTDLSGQNTSNAYFPTFASKEDIYATTRHGWHFYWFFFYFGGIYYGPYVTFTVWDQGVQNDCQYQYTDGNTWVDNRWHNFIATKGKDNLNLYIDRVLQVTASHNLGNISNTDPLTIGGVFGDKPQLGEGSDPFADYGGYLDRIRIFKGYELDQSDVNEIYDAKYSSKPMAAFYDFQDNFFDTSGNGNNGYELRNTTSAAPSAGIIFVEGVGGRQDETLSFQLVDDELKFKEISTTLSFKLNDYDASIPAFQIVLEFMLETGGIY